MSRLRTASVLFTGRAGAIGSAIVHPLPDGVPRARILDNLVRGRREDLSATLEDPRAELIGGDLRAHDLVYDVTKGGDLVFHQAGDQEHSVRREASARAPDPGRRHLHGLTAAAQQKVDKVIAASSASVYGVADQFPVDERHRQVPVEEGLRRLVEWWRPQQGEAIGTGPAARA